MPQHNHAPESWCVAFKEGSPDFGKGQTHVYDAQGRYLGTFQCHESAKRAAVCVNACAGLDTDQLEYVRDMLDVKRVLAALKAAKEIPTEALESGVITQILLPIAEGITMLTGTLGSTKAAVDFLVKEQKEKSSNAQK